MNGTAIRRWHTYIGFLTGPSLIFFCLTGAVQLFSLHEAHGTYHPYEWVEKLSSVHKDQVLEKHDEHEHDHHHADQAPPPDAAEADRHGDHDDADHDESSSVATVALKVVFLLVSLGLTTSAVLGIWIGVTQLRQKRLCWILLGTGIILPLLLLALG